jgi:hypothetical protein
MSGIAILEDLRRQGVRVWVEDGELRYRGPKKALTPEALAGLKAHKAEILDLLQPEPSEAPCHHGTPGGCWLCKKYSTPPTPEKPVASVLEDPPCWLRSYIRGYRRGNVSLYVLSGAVAAAMGCSPHKMASELLPAVEVCLPDLSEDPAPVVAA